MCFGAYNGKCKEDDVFVNLFRVLVVGEAMLLFLLSLTSDKEQSTKENNGAMLYLNDGENEGIRETIYALMKLMPPWLLVTHIWKHAKSCLGSFLLIWMRFLLKLRLIPSGRCRCILNY
ncbi:hypothetical protein K2173_023250 [Erythroxylum novogranatense]|uniref:Uncharacterized protein n=1 Tax=Erythroxylum novogranatense TaxID=1862640 RepID=A0AAV8T8G4_9ROSI|nr:hypothetical protein K2173_023250 [Erythroxylum novogranatense]